MATDLLPTLQENFQLLQRLFGGSFAKLPDAAKSEVTGFMALNFDKLGVRGNQIEIALSHYFQVSGDSIADPDMVLRVDLAARSVEAISYQDSFGYRTVYVQGGERDEREYRSQNKFLGTWLRNCISQGHQFRGGESSLGPLR